MLSGKILHACTSLYPSNGTVTTVKTCNTNINVRNDEQNHNISQPSHLWIDNIQEQALRQLDALSMLVDDITEVNNSELSPQFIQKTLTIQCKLAQQVAILHQRLIQKPPRWSDLDECPPSEPIIIKKEDYATHPLMSQLKSINILNHYNQTRPLQLKIKILSIPNDIALFYYAQGLPPKDLTKYGIEPNPGPVSTKMKVRFCDNCSCCQIDFQHILDTLHKHPAIKIIEVEVFTKGEFAISVELVTTLNPSDIHDYINAQSSLKSKSVHGTRTIFMILIILLVSLLHPQNIYVSAFGENCLQLGNSLTCTTPGYAPIGTNVMTQLSAFPIAPLFQHHLTILAQQNLSILVSATATYTGSGFFDDAASGGIWSQSICNIAVYPTPPCVALNGANTGYSIYLSSLCDKSLFYSVGTLPPTLALAGGVSGSGPTLSMRLYAGDVLCIVVSDCRFRQDTLISSGTMFAFYTIAGTSSSSAVHSWASCSFNVALTIDDPLNLLLTNVSFPALLDVNVVNTPSVIIAGQPIEALVAGVTAGVTLPIGGSVTVSSLPSVTIGGSVNIAQPVAFYAPEPIPVNVTNSVQNVYLNISTLINNTVNTPIPVVISSQPNLVYGSNLYEAKTITGYSWLLNQTVGPTPPPQLLIEDQYAVSRKMRNRRKHAENGNMSVSSRYVTKNNNSKKSLVQENQVDFESSDSDFESQASTQSKISVTNTFIHNLKHAHHASAISSYNFYSILYFCDSLTDQELIAYQPEIDHPDARLENIVQIEKAASDHTSDMLMKQIHTQSQKIDNVRKPGRNPNDRGPTISREQQMTQFFSKINSPETFSHWLLLRRPRVRTAAYLLAQSKIRVSILNPTVSDIIIAMYVDGMLRLNSGSLDSCTALACIFNYCITLPFSRKEAEAYLQYKFGCSISQTIGLMHKNNFRVAPKNNKDYTRFNHSKEPLQIPPPSPSLSETEVEKILPPKDLTRYGIERQPGPGCLGMSINKYMHMVNGNLSDSNYTESNPIGSGYKTNAEVEARPNITALPQEKPEEVSMCPSVEKFVTRVNGSNPVYAAQNTTVPLSMSLNITTITNTNTFGNNPTQSFPPRESPLTLRTYRPSGGGVPVNAVQRMSIWNVATTNASARDATQGVMYTRVYASSISSNLRTNNIYSNGFRAVDHLSMGNAAWGSGDPSSKLSAMPDSLFRIGLKVGLTQIMLSMGTQASGTASVGGFVNNIDSYQELNAFITQTIVSNPLLTIFGEQSVQNGFALPTPIFPFLSSAPSPFGSPVGTGRFAIITSLSIVDPSDYPFVFAVPPEIWRKTQGRPGLAIAMLLIMLSEYPASIFSMDVATQDANAANLQTIAAVFNSSLIKISGSTTIYFLVESKPGADIPYNQQVATASTALDFFFADAVSQYAAGQQIFVSFEGNLLEYEITSMIASWWLYISTNLFWEVALSLPRICNRMDDFNAGIHMSVCLTMRYKTMIVGLPGQGLPGATGSTLLGTDCTDFASVRPQILTADLPLSNVTNVNYSVPGESMFFISCCVMELIQPTRSIKGSYEDWFGNDLQSPYIFDSLRMHTRILAAGWDLVYEAMGQSVAAWNNIVQPITPQGNLFDNYSNNAMVNYPYLRQLMRNFYINSTTTIPPTANGTPPFRAALSKYMNYYIPKDSFGNTWERYRNVPLAPGSTTPNPNGGDPEPVQAFAGVKGTVNGVFADCACYIPQTLTTLERHSVFFRETPKANSWWPLPYSEPLKPLRPPGSQTIQAVVNNVVTFSFPMRDVNINILGSRSQLQLPDEFHYLLRVCRQTQAAPAGFSNCLYWGTINASNPALGRRTIVNNNGVLNGGIYPQKSLGSFNAVTYNTANDFYSNDVFIPATNIDGNRNCIFIDNSVNATLWQLFSSWQKGILPFWANTILGSFMQEPLAALDNQDIGISWNVDQLSDNQNLNQKSISTSKDEVPDSSSSSSSNMKPLNTLASSSTDISAPAL